ncbi:MAG: phage integrase SAM-like domain-containing protein [Agriterribacter sp.]
MYTVSLILHTSEGKDGLKSVLMRVIWDRKKYYRRTGVRVKDHQLEDGLIVKHPSARSFNSSISRIRLEIENGLSDLIRERKDTPENIKNVVTGKKVSYALLDVAERVIAAYTGRHSENTLHNYRVSTKKLDEYQPGITIHECTYTTLSAFEQWLRIEGIEKKEKDAVVRVPMDVNTVSKYMQMIKSVLNKAADMDLIDTKVFDKYKRPPSIVKIPVWLSESEIEDFLKVIQKETSDVVKQAGYYFLLSCYTGYRMGDAKAFDYSQRCTKDSIVIRAKKNGTIVSMPIHDKLKPILEYCKDNKLTLSEQGIRTYVKILCGAAGINKHVKFHSGRHTFAMLLMAKGFTIDEAAELLGDTPLVAKVYARIHNDTLRTKILDRFK